LSSVKEKLGKYEEAKEICLRSILIKKKFFGEGHIEIGKTQVTLSQIYISLGDIEQA
jgi:hypothetical protein